MYRHPSSTFSNFEEIFLKVLRILNEKRFCNWWYNVNINLFKRDQCTCDFLNCISSAGAKQFVYSPTKLSSYCFSSSLIYLFYSSFWREKLNVNVVDYDISDHMPVICEFKC